ncbi:MAG: SMEK domain-containing protein [Clostridium sp.]|nr:SMEK domain-containing protein [Clostridium sp.]
MLNREVYLNQIIHNLALLSKEVELRGAINLYDINIIAEYFYADLLNLIYGYKLKNVNIIDKNAAAIDLADEENRIAIQVTSDNTSTKIKHTISEFIEHHKYERYNRLIILILTSKKGYTSQFETEGKISFNKEEDIIDIADLTQVLRDKDANVLQVINDFLEKELYEKISIAKPTEASEVDTIIDLIEYITKHRKLGQKRDSVVDPDYKINKRFKDFANSLINEYTTMYMLYGEAVNTVSSMLQIDEVQEIIIVLYLQDISVQYLDKCGNNPIQALNELVSYFDEKLSSNGKRYDRAAIKFYLVNEMIKCNVFPNERDEYNASK